MTAHVTIEGFRDVPTDWAGNPLAKVGDKVTVIVKLWDYANLKAGKFTLQHPAMEDEDFEAPWRWGSGERSLGWVGFRAATQEDLSRVETIDCTVKFTKPCDALTAFSIVAKENCVGVVAPAQTIRCVADEEAFRTARLTLRSGRERGVKASLKLTKAASTGPASKTSNTVRTYVRLFAQLYFKDPEGNERPFPKDMPVRVLLGKNPKHAIDTVVEDDGKLTLEVIGHTDVLAAKDLTLAFGPDPGSNQVLCELPGGTQAQTRGPVPGETDPTGTLPNRMFTWPAEWFMREAKWTVTNDDGRWKESDGTFAMTKGGVAQSLGKDASRVKLVLEPVWQFLRFEFVDRVYGHSDHADAPKTMPAVMLEGFRVKPTLPTAEPDVRSNWWVEQGGETVQCVPWILQKAPDGTAAKRPSPETLLRFTLPPKTCIRSSSATARARVIATDLELAPGPDRLQFYDLPKLWHSQNYYAKLSTTVGEFGWYEAVVGKTTSKTSPLVFSLDDIVLTDDQGRRIATWSHADRCALFANTFDDSLADCTKEGVYKPDAGADLPWFTQKPGPGAPEETRNYIIDRPNWVRLIVAEGNLYDVFDKRTVASSPANPAADVIGARAAVCWLDTTKRIGTTQVGDFGGTGGAWQWSTTHAPEAGKMFFPGLPARVDHPTFSIQPFYDQLYVARQGVYDAAAGDGCGRIDVALLRCCALADRATPGQEKEVAVQLYFLKQHLNFVNEPADGRAKFQVDAQRALLDSWNGVQPAFGRAKLTAVDSTKRLLASVVTFVTFTRKEIAHFTIEVKTGSDARNNRGGQLGTGLLSDGKHVDSGTVNGFTNAHEHGHERALPDEYNERWNCASFGEASFGQHLPGDPYELDGRTSAGSDMGSPMMNGCGEVQARYHWQSAEWVRRAAGFPFKLSFNGFDDFTVPPHADARRNYVFWPLVGLNNQVLPAVAPLTANRARFHLFLYALGKDRFSVNTLPARKDPPGGAAFDGILLVTLLLKVTAPVGDEASLKTFSQALARVARRFMARKLNHRWYLTGTAAASAPHEWTFQRCLIHFAPRLLVSVDELPTRAQFLASAAGFETDSICTDFASRLDNYHAVPWAPIGPKRTQITAVRATIVEPTFDVRGDWATASAQIPDPPVPPTPTDGSPPLPLPPPAPVRPAEFGAIDTSVNTYASTATSQIGVRQGQVKELVGLCDAFLNTDPTNPYAPALTALRDRADQKLKTLNAWVACYWVQKRAGTLEADRTKHNETVTKVSNTHGQHFELTCTIDPAAPAKWDIGAPIVELPLSAKWLETVDADVRTDARVQTAVASLDEYHDAAPEDYAARMTALDKVGTAAAANPVPAPRGDWDTASVITGQSRPIGFSGIDLALANAASKGADDYAGRAAEYAKVNRLVDREVSSCPQPFRPGAQALKTRVTASRNEDLALLALRKVEALAAPRKAQLLLEAASRKVALTAPDADGFEDAMLEVFPSLFGVYKPADKITAADLDPLVALLGLTSPVVAALS
ncbi:MAG: hypothetical protein Q8S73_24040 [Deltaproteobacteria bacterium]|nr:hypothetical protein [Myxococcales bacterium]MDP3217204.1 hypothetical protein [Deltaproteobacteria bacterium]